ncbi:unnamed protein product [Larinioides sclopetarius]|uniref:Uncharacterized protein n=1 Tax=Larinioides sclopetarius TaxID=280406 RepID=A0AAV2BX23_9ARAC
MCALNAVGRPQEAKVDAEYEWAFFKRSSMGSSKYVVQSSSLLCRFSRVHNSLLSQLQMRPRLCADASNIILRTLRMFDWEGWLMVNSKVSLRRQKDRIRKV